MIRVWVEGGQQALFEDNEEITVCRKIIAGEYIVDERWCEAFDLLCEYDSGDRYYQFIFLDSDRFDLSKAAAIGSGPLNIYRIVKIEQLSNKTPAFLEQ
jgi:hypothetical protein